MNGIYINLGSSSSSSSHDRVEDLILTLEGLESKVREEYEAVFVLAKGKVWKSSWRHYLLAGGESSQEQRTILPAAAAAAAAAAAVPVATSAH